MSKGIIPRRLESGILIVTDRRVALSLIGNVTPVLKLPALGSLVNAQRFDGLAVRVPPGIGVSDCFFPACVQRQSFGAEQRAVEIPLVALQAFSGLVPTGKDVACASKLLAGDFGRIQNVGVGIVGKIDFRVNLRGLGFHSSSAKLKGHDVFPFQVLPFAGAP